MLNDIVERFCRYARIDTTSDETSATAPSTAKQLDLSRLLADECRQLGLIDVSCSEHGIVIATIPATVSHAAPGIAWVAHVDTSPEYSGTNVKPTLHRNYAGGDITLPGDPSKVLTVADNPELLDLMGETIITSDGTTLLGADDKSGIAVIMTAAAELMANRSILHGPIRVCFTVDEEIGRGIENLDLRQLNSVCAYTLDSDGYGRVDGETFSADQAIVTVHGINTHPSVGKGEMVNAVRILSAFLDRLPQAGLSPETTTGREGFVHPYHVEGGVAECSARLILRDFETENLQRQAELLRQIAASLQAEFPRAKIDVHIREQYRNMREGLQNEPRAYRLALEATRNAGLTPREEVIRGGTDGSLMTAAGLPTPNLSSGQHNPHSPLEWTSEKEMQDAVRVLIELAKLWGQERT